MKNTDFENKAYFFINEKKRKIIFYGFVENIFNTFKICFFHHV
jgi:hypothetical protein